MDLRKLILISALVISAPASSDVVTEIDAVEVTVSNISVPTTVTGRLMFKPCAGECDETYTIVRLTADTGFVVRGQSMSFVEFRQSLLSLGRGSDAYALVSYDTKSKIVTNIRIGQ